MSTDPYAHLDAVYLLGALEPAERANYEAHLAACPQCRADLAEISAIPPLFAGLDEADFAVPSDERTTPASASARDTLPRLLRAVRRRRTRSRWLTAGLGLGVAGAVGAAALIVLALPLGHSSLPPARAMTALVASPLHATVGLRAAPWGTAVEVTCWNQPGASVQPEDQYNLVAHGTDRASYQLGSWRLNPGQKITVASGVALRPRQIKSLTITERDGTAILTLTI